MLYISPKMGDIKYLLGVLLALPALPLMYIQGKRIRASVPKLPHAKGPSGRSGSGGGAAFRLITLGESTIAGIGVETHTKGFSGTLAKALSNQLGKAVDWKVYAKSGYTAALVTEKLIPKIKEEEIDLIVIGLGGNDAFHLNAPWRWRRDIRSLIVALRERFPQTTVVFTNMPPIRSFPAFTPLIQRVVGNHVELLGQSLERVVQPLPNIFYYDRVITLEDWRHRLGVTAPPSDFFSDGVHPSELTYQVWARDVAGFIKKGGIIE
jgi:lysophospholipase L1-like esterase